MTEIRVCCVLLFTIVVINGCNKVQQSHDSIISNVNIVDVVNGRVISDKSVVIDSGKISAIIDRSQLGQHTSSLIIDGSGKYLLPGLWDMHVHFRGGDDLIDENKALLPLYIINGITGVRDAGGDLTASIQSWQNDILANKLIGPTIFTSGPKLDGPDARWAGSLEVSNNEEVNAAIDSLESLAVDYIKIYDSRISKEVYLYILEEAQRRNIKTSGHMPFTVMLQEALDRNIHSIEHLYYVLKGCSSEEQVITQKIINGEMGFWDSFNQLMATYDPEIAQSTFASMIEHDTYSVPTLHIGHILSYLDQTDHSQDEYLQYIGSGIQSTYEGRIKRAMSADSAAISARHTLHETFRDLTFQLYKSGVQILAGSDGGAYNSYVYPGISLHKELELMVECGIPPAEVLKTCTINGARFMGVEERYGSAEVGKIADLVLLSSNPLEDITSTRDISDVILQGRVYSSEDLSKLLESIKSE